MTEVCPSSLGTPARPKIGRSVPIAEMQSDKGKRSSVPTVPKVCPNRAQARPRCGVPTVPPCLYTGTGHAWVFKINNYRSKGRSMSRPNATGPLRDLVAKLGGAKTTAAARSATPTRRSGKIPTSPASSTCTSITTTGARTSLSTASNAPGATHSIAGPPLPFKIRKEPRQTPRTPPPDELRTRRDRQACRTARTSGTRYLPRVASGETGGQASARLVASRPH